MKLLDIKNSDDIYIGKTSVTVKRDGKTVGVISNLGTYNTRTPRSDLEIQQRFRDNSASYIDYIKTTVVDRPNDICIFSTKSNFLGDILVIQVNSIKINGEFI